MSNPEIHRSVYFGDGTDGTWFDDAPLYEIGTPRIKELFIWSSNHVHGIHVFYNNGTSAYHGIVKGSFHRVQLDEDESITRIEGHHGNDFDKMTIKTSKDNTHGPFGTVTSKRFETNFAAGRELKYIFGRFATEDFRNIGFADGPVPMKEPKQTMSYGTFDGANVFSDRDFFEQGHPSITAITVYPDGPNGYIKGLAVEYSNGQPRKYGKVSDTNVDKVRFDIDDDDYITGVKLFAVNAIDQIEFYTLKKGPLGPVGKKPSPRDERRASQNFHETFPSGSRLLYLEGETTEKDGIVSISFGYGFLSPSQSLVYSKSIPVNENCARTAAIYDSFAYSNGGRKKIQKVRVHHQADYICAIDFMYDGVWFPEKRSNKYTENVFELDDDEYLVKVTGRTQSDWVASICFHTSKDRKSPVYCGNAGTTDFSISQEGSVIAAYYAKDSAGYCLWQFGMIFVSGLVARVDVINVTPHFENKVEKLGNPYVIGRALLKNESGMDQQTSVDLTHIDTKSEVVTTGHPFSTSVHVSRFQSSPHDNNKVEKALGGNSFLSLMAKGEASSATKENVIHVSAKVSPGKILTATALASNLVVTVPFSSDSTLHYAGSSKTKSVTLNGTYASSTAQISVEYEKEKDAAS